MTPFAQAAVLVCAQAPTLRDPSLLADPLFAVSGAAHMLADLCTTIGACCLRALS